MTSIKSFRFKSTDRLYLLIWGIVVLLYLLDITRSRLSVNLEPALTPAILGKMAMTLLPILLLFAVNNYLLIPRFLLPGKIRRYLLWTALATGMVFLWQYIDFLGSMDVRPPHHPGDPIGPPPRRLLPLPLLLDMIYDGLVIGGNIAIALIFQRFQDRLDHERLLKANMENELSHLRAQINPHFYMNMLNNIHGMIGLNPEGAQEMVLDMSRLMRYLLYDSTRPSATLREEVEFIRTYLRIMRRRYPDSRVEIKAVYPDPKSQCNVSVPPLIFLVFVENAFKHGVSYMQKSFVHVAIRREDERLVFSVVNSNPSNISPDKREPGIGLMNVRQRLGLIYGQNATLETFETEGTYQVRLTLPLNIPQHKITTYEIKDNSDRR